MLQDDFKLKNIEASSFAVELSLRNFGLCVVDDWVSDTELDRLNIELQRSVANPKTDANADFNPGKIAVRKRSEIGEALPETHRQFSNPIFEEVARNYVGRHIAFNDDIFITDHSADDRVILPLHYDRLWCLKFYLYLKDTSQNDGAFEAIPGSHHAAGRRRRYLLSRGVPAFKLPNREDPVGLKGAYPLEGKAGTLIVFDSDVLHKGGVVGAGGRRLVMRGHTHRTPTDVYHPKPWTSQWVREAKHNPITALRRIGDRVSGIDHRLKL